MAKKFMYMNTKAPYGTIYALESLEVVLIGAAFEQDVSVAFVGDGVYQLTKGQKTAEIGMKCLHRPTLLWVITMSTKYTLKKNHWKSAV